MGLSELDTYISVRLVRHNGMWLLEGEHPQREGTIRWVPSENELKLLHDGRRHIFPLRSREDMGAVICYVDFAHELHLRHTTRCYYSDCNCPYLCDDGHCDIADGFMYPHGPFLSRYSYQPPVFHVALGLLVTCDGLMSNWST